MADKETIWLGTDGDGVVQLSAGGVLQRQWGTADGLLSPRVKALSLFGGRLWIGFGDGNRCGLGYIDPVAGRFTTLTPPQAMEARQDKADGPPVSPVHAIKTADMKAVWVATQDSLKRYQIESDRWSTPLPFGPPNL